MTTNRTSVVHVVVVAALAAFMLGSTLPNLFANNVGLPFSMDDHNRVNAVFADGLSVRVGDVVDWPKGDLVQKLAVIGAYFFEPGTTVTMPLTQGDVHFVATLRVQPQPSVFRLVVVKRGSATAFVVIAAILLLRRPSKMLWGFFLYALGNVNGHSLGFEWEPIGF